MAHRTCPLCITRKWALNGIKRISNPIIVRGGFRQERTLGMTPENPGNLYIHPSC